MLISNTNKTLINKVINFIDIFISLYALVSIIALIGFYLSDSWFKVFYYSVNFIIGLFILERIVNLIIANDKIQILKLKWFEYVMSLLMSFHLIFGALDYNLLGVILPNLEFKQLTIVYLAIIHILLFFSNLINLLRYNHLISKIQLNPGAIFGISFLILILSGTFLLLMPRATYLEHRLSFIDALFTSTSAVCVTGLIVTDTATTFTPLGKLIIIFLIQIGGLGVMSITSLFAAFFAGGLSIKARILMKEALSSLSISNIKSLILKIIGFTFFIEFIGSIFLYFYSGGSYKYLDIELYYEALFHSISAFCNAGFSVYTPNLMQWQVLNPGYLYTISTLIVLGGLGFAVLLDITNYLNPLAKSKPKGLKLMTTTKIVLITTGLLIVSGAVFFYFWEFLHYVPPGKDNLMSNPNFEYIQSKLNFVHSIFLSVTARTAGFNTIPIENLSYPAVFFMFFLMFIGASPGSTGGGVKTTTFALSLIAIKNMILAKSRTELFNKEIGKDTIIKSYKIILLSLILIFVASFFLIILEPDKNPIDLIFEAVSAFATVGLSRNITFYLSDSSKIIIILLMFIGRIGVVNFITSFYNPKPEPKYKLPTEEINVG